MNRKTGVTKRFPPELFEVAQRKLQYLHSATRLDDLRCPPGNRLEALKGKQRGRLSVRINDQWRVVFSWSDGASGVEVIDYH